MADTPEQKTLNEIKAVLTDTNRTQQQAKEAYEKSQKAFPAESFKSLTKETGDQIKKQRQALKGLMDNQSENTSQGLAKFLGVDFKSEFFMRLDKIGSSFAEVKKGFKDLSKALGLDKVAKKVGGFWDFLKKIFAVGLATIGLIKFIEGWNKADEIFGKAAGFGERLSAGLATVIGSFMGLTDGEINTLAKDINVTVQGIMTFLKTEFNALTTALKAAWPGIKETFNGFVKLLEGDFIGGVKSFSTGVTNIGTELWNSESMLAKAVVILAGLKIAGAALSFVGAIKPIFTALSTIGSGIGTIFTALGGKAAFAAAMSALPGILSGMLLPLAAIAGLFIAAKAGFDGVSAGMEEFDKSGDLSKALSVGIGGFVKSLLNILTFGLLSDETLQKVQDNISKFLDPVFEGIAGLFKSIWSWIKDKWDDVTFNIKDFLGMELTQAERLKKADKDIAAAEANMLEKEAAVANSKSEYTRNKNQRYLDEARAELEKAQKTKFDLANPNEIDNKILQSGVSTYNDYMNSLRANNELTDEQRMNELKEANEARNKGQSFQNFQNSQVTQNNAIIQKIRPQTDLSIAN